MKHTMSDLYQMQSMPLSIKVRMTENRIRGWIEEYEVDGVYVSFSGVKTVPYERNSPQTVRLYHVF